MKKHTSQHTVPSIIAVLSKPTYTLITLVSGLIVLGTLIWFFSFDTLLYLVGLPNYPISDKLSYFFSGYTNSALYFFRDPVVFTRVVFSVLAGINIGLYVFIRKHQQPITVRKGLGGFGVALLASGCVACGISILSPLVAGVSAGAAVTIGRAVGSIGNIIGIGLMIYLTNGFGKRISYKLARQNIIEKEY